MYSGLVIRWCTMTKAELEDLLTEMEGQLAKSEAKLATFKKAALEAKERLEMLEAMLDLVDQRSSVFYGDWRGYEERSKG
ncbi:hypothetical protein AVV32_gp51 [Pseudomonas phage PhiCHU]|uniref:Uncharacterized protein n=1 Tax=Pseudomonas phage PhiCHU TaxID=1589273 RepID=A0A0B5A451_9CAUD|nr:hypothetical protein AVV32_gp51 [Pseudomonas phage PhiCHU]AJD82744.1 hypothetical protein PhiCHU_51 [Pseudomonas phage PhiCHU]